MVDFVKRALSTGDIEPDEEVLAGCNMTPSPFGVPNAGMTGGLIAGGVVGMAVGAAWDSRRRKKDEIETADKALPEVAVRQPYEPPVSTNGSLFAVTTKRVVVWNIGGLGKPREVLLTIPLSAIDQVVWEDADAKWLGGKPASLVLWIGVGDRVLACAGISMGPGGRYVRSVLEALQQRLPGKVTEWSG